jgi:hypothetical protein
VQQILLSQFSDDEVEIIYLNRDKFHEAYGKDILAAPFGLDEQQRRQQSSNNLYDAAGNDTFDIFSRINKSSGNKKSRVLGRGSFFMSPRQ